MAAGRAGRRRNRPAGARCAACRSRFFAMPSSSMVSAITAAPKRFASTSALVARSSPSSKLIELMIGLPPCSFSAASITGVSVLSITSGALTAPVKRRITSLISPHLVAADEGGADIERVRAFADLLAAHRDAAVPVVAFLQLAPSSSSRWRCSARRSRDRRFPGATAPADRGWRRDGTHTALRATWRRAGSRPRPGAAASHPARRCGRSSVPQQPPIRLTPSSATKRSSHGASLGRRQRIMRVAVDQLGQAGIGLHRDQAGPVRRPAIARARPSPAGRWRSSARSAARPARAPRWRRRRCRGRPAACRWFRP